MLLLLLVVATVIMATMVPLSATAIECCRGGCIRGRGRGGGGSRSSCRSRRRWISPVVCGSGSDHVVVIVVATAVADAVMLL